MKIIGFRPEEVTSVFQLVSCVLKLGNIQFQHHNNIDGTDGCRLVNENGKKKRVAGETGVRERVLRDVGTGGENIDGMGSRIRGEKIGEKEFRERV